MNYFWNHYILLILQNNLAIGIRTPLIDIEIVKFDFMNFFFSLFQLKRKFMNINAALWFKIRKFNSILRHILKNNNSN